MQPIFDDLIQTAASDGSLAAANRLVEYLTQRVSEFPELFEALKIQADDYELGSARRSHLDTDPPLSA